MFLDSKVKLCERRDGVKYRPVINFQHLDQILSLKNNLESVVYYNNALSTLQAKDEDLRDELTKVHQFSNNPEFSLKEVTYDRGNPIKFTSIDLTELFNKAISLCQEKLRKNSFSSTLENLLKPNIIFLEKVKNLWTEISSGEVTPAENKAKAISETPVLLLEHTGRGGYSGTRVIVNPKFKSEARACSDMYSIDWTINNFRRALELGDHRVQQIFISDPEESVKLTKIKYLDLGNGIENPNWELRAIDYLSQLTKQGKVKDSQGQLLAA